MLKSMHSISRLHFLSRLGHNSPPWDERSLARTHAQCARAHTHTQPHGMRLLPPKVRVAIQAHLQARVGAPRVGVLLSPADLELVRQRARESGRGQGVGAESSWTRNEVVLGAVCGALGGVLTGPCKGGGWRGGEEGLKVAGGRQLCQLVMTANMRGRVSTSAVDEAHAASARCLGAAGVAGREAGSCGVGGPAEREEGGAGGGGNGVGESGNSVREGEEGRVDGGCVDVVGEEGSTAKMSCCTCTGRDMIERTAMGDHDKVRRGCKRKQDEGECERGGKGARWMGDAGCADGDEVRDDSEEEEEEDEEEEDEEEEEDDDDDELALDRTYLGNACTSIIGHVTGA